MLAAATAHMDAEFVGERSQAALEGADDAGGDAGRMPVHAHHRAERLEPERMGEAPEQLVAAVVMDHPLAEDGPNPAHPLSQPWRDAPAVERKIRAAASMRQDSAPGRSPIVLARFS